MDSRSNQPITLSSARPKQRSIHSNQPKISSIARSKLEGIHSNQASTDSGSSSPKSRPLSPPAELMDWDTINGRHLKLSEQLGNIGQLSPIPESSTTNANEPELQGRRPASPSTEKELERAKMKELLAAYLSSRKPKEVPKKKVPKVHKNSSTFARLAAPTHSSMAKQTKKWNGKENTATTEAKTSVATPGSSAQCSKAHGHVDGCLCSRHTKRFPDFKP